MHQPEAQPRASLYFDYRVHPAWLPSAHEVEEEVQVAIVGGGPIGLALALDLARHGVRCVLLEAERQVSEGSRAIVFTRRSMEILHQLGVAGRVAAKGLPWRYGNSYYRGRRVFRMAAQHDADQRFLPMTNLQQPYLERYLAEALGQSPHAELRWGNRVSAIAQDEDGVRLTVETPAGDYALRAQWVVAADGARSTLRQLLGLKMEGTAYEGRFVIADIRVELDLPTERLAFFDPPWNPGNTVLMHREPDGIWRVDYQLPPGETAEEALAPAALRSRIDAALALVGAAGQQWELDWCSVYSARAMTLPDYLHGRVAFVGDAAHLLPIFGVRGANTGFQDAHDLAWKLALELRGCAGPGLLPSYSQERVAAAREIIDEAGKSTRFMTPPSPGYRLLRDAVLSLALSEEFVRPLLHWRTSRAHDYAASALNCVGDDDALFEAGPGHGAPCTDLRLGGDAFLLDHLGPAFQLLYFGAGPTPEVLACMASFRQRGVPLRLLLVERSGVNGAVEADQILPDSEGRLRQHFGVTVDGAAYLLRPDQHVCARWLTLSADRLEAALNAALGHSNRSFTS